MLRDLIKATLWKLNVQTICAESNNTDCNRIPFIQILLICTPPKYLSNVFMLWPSIAGIMRGFYVL